MGNIGSLVGSTEKIMWVTLRVTKNLMTLKSSGAADRMSSDGAQKRTRTSTVLPPPGPEPGASTNSAIWALLEGA